MKLNLATHSTIYSCFLCVSSIVNINFLKTDTDVKATVSPASSDSSQHKNKLREYLTDKNVHLASGTNCVKVTAASHQLDFWHKTLWRSKLTGQSQSP